jgi:hypothetical protein
MSVEGKNEEHIRRRKRRRRGRKMGCGEKDEDILCVFSI